MTTVRPETTAAGHGTSKLVASNAYGWQCTSPAAAVDTNAACNHP